MSSSQGQGPVIHRPCKFFAKGPNKCRNGNYCKFVHVAADAPATSLANMSLRPQPCSTLLKIVYGFYEFDEDEYCNEWADDKVQVNAAAMSLKNTDTILDLRYQVSVCNKCDITNVKISTDPRWYADFTIESEDNYKQLSTYKSTGLYVSIPIEDFHAMLNSWLTKEDLYWLADKYKFEVPQDISFSLLVDFQYLYCSFPEPNLYYDRKIGMDTTAEERHQIMEASVRALALDDKTDKVALTSELVTLVPDVLANIITDYSSGKLHLPRSWKEDVKFNDGFSTFDDLEKYVRKTIGLDQRDIHSINFECDLKKSLRNIDVPTPAQILRKYQDKTVKQDIVLFGQFRVTAKVILFDPECLKVTCRSIKDKNEISFMIHGSNQVGELCRVLYPFNSNFNYSIDLFVNGQLLDHNELIKNVIKSDTIVEWKQT